MKKLIPILLLLLYGCGYNDSDPARPVEVLPGQADATMADIKALYVQGGTTVTANALLKCRVTSSDRSGNFYRTLFVEDETGGIEILTGIYDTHNDYLCGQVVYLMPQGLTINRREGMYQMGIRGAEHWQLTYINNKTLIDKHLAVEHKEPERPLPVRVSELDEGMVGRLVRIAGVTFPNGGTASWAVSAARSSTGYPEEKEREALDLYGRSVRVRTSGYASFADSILPVGEVSVTGIVHKGGAGYYLKIRDLHDVAEL